MRIISGAAHGRRLRAPRGLATRPTLARVRESIFSRLTARTDLSGAVVLDLFAGSGSLGIEALSRGAARVVFVEMARAAALVIEHNLAALGLSDRARLLRGEVRRSLAQLAGEGARFDLVLVDPPFEQGYGAPVLADLAELHLVAPGGWVVVEVARRELVPDAPAGLEQQNVATVGDAQIALYQCVEGPRLNQEL